MASHKSYEGNKRKYAGSDNLFMAPNSSKLDRAMSDEQKEKFILWNTFYRRNMHRFIEHYFGLQLFLFQKIWIYLMSISDTFVAICSRATGKTWLLGVFALARAVLYPGSKIVVVASTKEQAGIIIEEKISELRDIHPNVAREISRLVTNMNNWRVDFHNGSKIVVVAARDSSRGSLNFCVYELFAQLNLI